MQPPIQPQQPANPGNTQSLPSSGLGQQRTENPTQNNPGELNKEPIQQQPTKKKNIFKSLDEFKPETMVFSKLMQLLEKFAVKTIKNVTWKEQYTDRLPKKPNFYRFVAFDNTTGKPSHYLLIRGDKPLPDGMYRVVIDKFQHEGMAKAKYFNNIEALKDFVSKQYGIDTSTIELTIPSKDVLFDAWVRELHRSGDKSLDKLFNLNVGTSEENKKFVTEVIKETLKASTTEMGFDLINKVEELSKTYFPIDLTEEKKRLSRFGLRFTKNKEKYKELFDEEVPFLTRDPKLIDSITRLHNASDTNNKFHADMMKDLKVLKEEVINTTSSDITIDDILMPGDKPLVVPANDFMVLPHSQIEKSKKIVKLIEDGSISISEGQGLYIDDFAEYLKKMNAYNPTVLQIASEVAQTGMRVTMQVKNNTDKKIKIEDIEPNITIKKDETVTVSSMNFKNSMALREALSDGDISIVPKSFVEKGVGFLTEEQLKKAMDYLKGVADSYNKYKGKSFKPFEHKVKMYTDPSVGWRTITPSTFRAELDMGDVYVPAPKEYMNIQRINEHFSQNEAIAFAYTHEVFVGNKKVWIIDEYQSDLVQQIGNLSDDKEEVTWYNPEGKSRRKRFKSAVENYYADWYKVFLNKMIKKAKAFGVDELWLIRGEDIYNHWYNRGGANPKDEEERQKELGLFRNIYDSTAIEYSQHANDPEMQELFKRYYDLVKGIKQYYDLQNQIEKASGFQPVIENPESTAEQKAEAQKQLERLGLQNFNIDEAKTELEKMDVVKMSKELNSVMEKVSVMTQKTRDIPLEIYNGKYHVIDVNKVPDEKLAHMKKGFTKIAQDEPDPEYWGKHALDWIMNTWYPGYKYNLTLPEYAHEKEMSPERAKVVGMTWFWEREIPRELKTDSKLLVAIRDYLRKEWAMPELDWADDIKMYIEGVILTHLDKRAGDNQDPSYEDAQTSPMEENFDNRLVDPDSIINRRKKGRGGPMSPEDGGDLRCNLPASVQVGHRTASDVVEQFLIRKEKEHVPEPEIKQELKDKGISDSEIKNTYQNRDKNLFKEVK